MFQQIFTKFLVILMVSLGLSGCGHTADIKIDQNIPLDVLKNEAEKSNPDAQCWLAICYATGLHECTLNTAKAKELYQKAAKNNNEKLPSVQFSKAICYHNGLNVSKDLNEAVKWCRKAAEQEFAPAQNCLASYYCNGDGVEKNMPEAIRLFRLAEAQGNAWAQYNLGICYSNGEGVEKNMAEAMKRFRKAAEQGHVDAQSLLGAYYANGAEGVEKNMAEAVKWIRKAAEQGHVISQFLLSHTYFYGNGVPKDEAEGKKWLLKSAENGLVDAQILLGRCYREGKFFKQNHEEAIKWFLKASELGCEEASQMIFKLLTVQPQPEGHDEAVKYIQKMAIQGNAEAQAFWALWLYDVEKDETEAVKWIRKAAKQGNSKAVAMLISHILKQYSDLMEKNATKLSQEDFSNSEEKVLYMNKMLKKILDEAKTYDISQCPLDFQEAWNDYLQKQNAFLQKQEEDCKFITKFNEKPPANQKELEQLKKIRDDDFEQTKNLGEKATKALAKVHEVSRKYLPNLQNKE